MMNYFELFEIPVSLCINIDELEKKYYRLCKLHHPDQQSTSTEQERESAITMTSTINNAFATLKNKETLLAYFLELNCALQEEEKKKLPSAFLAEMMEWNEEAMELESSNDNVQLVAFKEKIKNREEENYKEVTAYFTSEKYNYEPSDMAKLTDYYLKKKYLHRLVDRLA